MLNLNHFINFLRIEIRRRKSKKSGGKFKLKISNIPSFFQVLNQAEIPYVVLRWFEEVPLTPLEEKEAVNDIDFLFRHSDLKKMVRIGSQHPGHILAEFYSVSGKKGTSARGLPYYPPALATRIIENRILYKNTFYIPAPYEHFQSLCFHLVFHKGYESGLPINKNTPPKHRAKRDYPSLLQQLADEQNITLEQPVTLESIDRYLSESQWTMPYDLKRRWQFTQKEWIEYLCKAEEERDFTYAKKIPDLIVFLIRSDASDSPEILQATIHKIKKHFTIEQTIELSDESQNRVIQNVRGGNWLEHGGKKLIPPTFALLCFDPAPDPFTENHPDFKKSPHITNANVLLKNQIRTQINSEFPSANKKRSVVHSSDNTMEAHHHLLYVCGKENYPSICEELIDKTTPSNI